MSTERHTFLQYVALDHASAIKSEFLHGEIRPMAGGTPDHAAIAVNLSSMLREQLRDRPCRVFSSDLRIRVQATGLGTYPDVSVVCDELELDPEDPTGTTVINPRVIVEVMSPSTEDYDRGEKLEHYQRVDSLQEIILVAHGERRVDVWRRKGDDWHETVVRDESTLSIHTLEATLPLDEIYRNPLAR